LIKDKILPLKLKKGDSIGVVSPSTPVTPELEPQFKKGVEYLEALGFNIIPGNYLRSTSHSYTASPFEKAADLNSMFADDSIRAIVCSQGGVTSNACLPYLDWNLIHHHPKVFLGISDITVLLNAIQQKTGLITFHGNDIIWGFGRRPSEYDKREFLSTLIDGRIGAIPTHGNRRVVRPGVAQGRLMGGNLASMLKLAGTPYFPDLEGAILFLEAFEIKPEGCDHSFQQLKQMGVFDKIKGAVIGYIYSLQKNPEGQMQMEDVLLRVSEGYDFPIMKCNDFGHNCSNTVLPIGGGVRIDTSQLMIEITENYIL
jgi:muramoyltetrapeptide carboxypeptidase